MAAADANVLEPEDQILNEDIKDINVTDDSKANVREGASGEPDLVQAKSSEPSKSTVVEKKEKEIVEIKGGHDQQSDDEDDKAADETSASSCHGQGDTFNVADDMKEMNEKKTVEELISNLERSGHIHGEAKKGIRGVVNNLRLECGKRGRSTLLSFYHLWRVHLLKK